MVFSYCGTAFFTALSRYFPIPEQPTITVMTISSFLNPNSFRADSRDGGALY